MTVESNYVITIATLSDWLKRLSPVSTNEKQNQNQYHLVGWLLGIVIGSLWLVIRSSRRLFLLWLVGVIALVLVFRQSFENRSNVCDRSVCFVSYNTEIV